MMRICSRVLLLFVSAALLGCEPEQREDRPQETEPPGVDMDAERPDPDRDADVEIEVDGDRDTTRPGTPVPGAAGQGESRPPTFEVPTETPQTGEDETTIPDVDIEAPQTEGGLQGGLGGDQDDPAVPEVDIAPGTGSGEGSEPDGPRVPEVDPS